MYPKEKKKGKFQRSLDIIERVRTDSFFSLSLYLFSFFLRRPKRFSPIVSASCSIDPFKPDFYEVVSRRTGFHTSGFATSPSRGKSGCENVSVRVVRPDLRDPGSLRSWRTAIVRAFNRPIMRVASSESNYYFHDRARVESAKRCTFAPTPLSPRSNSSTCSLFLFVCFFLLPRYVISM